MPNDVPVVAKYRLSPRARNQLQNIWRDIAADNPVAADRLVDRLFEKFDRAASHPNIGAARPDIAADARMLVEGRYVAIYRPTDYGVRIVTVIHGMRDPANWLG